MKKVLITGALALALSATSVLAATSPKSAAKVESNKPAVTETSQSERTIRRVRHHHRRHHHRWAHQRVIQRRNR
jgi:hypothetical protein